MREVKQIDVFDGQCSYRFFYNMDDRLKDLVQLIHVHVKFGAHECTTIYLNVLEETKLGPTHLG